MGRILILEDDPDIAELYRLELEGRGHEILGIFDDPDDILEPRQELRRVLSPDLIVLDERLGSQSGTKHLKRIRQSFRSARVLIVSADPDAVDAGRKLGADAVASKPLSLRRLIESVESILGDSRDSG